MLDSHPLLSRSRIRLQTIVRLRWIAVVGQLIAILLVHFGLGFPLPLVMCLAIIATSATLNMVLRVMFPMRHRFSNTAATGLLLYDIMQLAFLLYLTGGIFNPFIFLLVAPVTVSAASLPGRNTIVLGAVAFAVTLLLIVYRAPLPWQPGVAFSLPTLYTLGIAASVASGMLFLALYTARLSKEAQQMSEALAATELVLAREQKLHALDGLAAAAAHELGTPLSTITLVAKELERELPPGTPLAEDAALLKSQADRCRDRHPGAQSPHPRGLLLAHDHLGIEDVDSAADHRRQSVTVLAQAPLGLGLGLLSGLAWATGTLILKRRPIAVPAAVLTGGQMLATAVPMTLGAAVLGDHQWFVPSWTSIAVILYIALVPMSIGNACWFAIVGLLPANVAGLSSIMVPMVAMVSGAIVHGEPLGPLQLTAMALSMASLSLVLLQPRRDG